MSKNRRARGRRKRSGSATVEVVWIKHLEVDPEKGLKSLGGMAMEDIRDDVLNKNRKGNDRVMPDLSTRYEVQKIKEGQSPEPDLWRTGRLWSQFRLLEIGKDFVTIGFDLATGNDVKKFRRLKRQHRNPLSLSKKDLKRFAKKFIDRGMLKEVPGPPPKKGRKK